MLIMLSMDIYIRPRTNENNGADDSETVTGRMNEEIDRYKRIDMNYIRCCHLYSGVEITSDTRYIINRKTIYSMGVFCF